MKKFTLMELVVILVLIVAITSVALFVPRATRNAKKIYRETRAKESTAAIQSNAASNGGSVDCRLETITHENCEYVVAKVNGAIVSIVHKGNCVYCDEK